MKKISLETACGESFVVDVDTDQEITGFRMEPDRPFTELATGANRLAAWITPIAVRNGYHLVERYSFIRLFDPWGGEVFIMDRFVLGITEVTKE